MEPQSASPPAGPNFRPTFPRYLLISAPMIGEQDPKWNHNPHPRPLGRTFDYQTAFGTLFRSDTTSFGHTSPFVVLLFSQFKPQPELIFAAGRSVPGCL